MPPVLTRFPSRRSFTCCTFVLVTLIVGTNMPSPLYAVYAHRFGFGPAVLTLVFAAYAGALIPALLLAAPAADAFGYRRVLLFGLTLALIGAAVFATADGLAWLVVARVLQGVSVGASSGAATAALVATEPTGHPQRAASTASLAATAGGGLGPLLAGACATWLPAPTSTCYLLEMGALVVAAFGLATVPWPLGRTGRLWRVSLPQVPAAGRGPIVRACATGFTGWAITAVFLSIVPSHVRTLTGSGNLLVAGAAAGLVLLVAAVSQLLAGQVEARLLQQVGLAALAGGAALLLVADSARLLTVVLAAAALAGVGQGLAFMGALRSVNRAASARTRSAVLAAFYVASYLGVGVPVVGVGLLAAATSMTAAVDAFAGAGLIGSLVVAAMHARVGRPTPAAPAHGVSQLRSRRRARRAGARGTAAPVRRR